LQNGIILKGYSGFYYVQTEDGVIECSLRGKSRQKKQEFYPGDRVIISRGSSGQGAIEDIQTRDTLLLRPPVANVSLLVIVMSLGYPQAELTLLDRLLVLAEFAGIRPLIVLSKLDTANEHRVEEIKADYVGTGYQFIATSTKSLEGLENVRRELAGETTVFAGQSGAGKTSLMNILIPEVQLKTGSLGDKSNRGKHTTRHIELFPYHGGYLVDTPGFNRLYVPEMQEMELQNSFPEFKPYQDLCRFATCRHYKEPDCMVKEHVDGIHISSRRYDNYIQFLLEINNKEIRYE